MKVIHFISSFGRGGKERQLMTIFKNNAVRDHHIRLLYLNDRLPNYIDEFQVTGKDLLKIKSHSFPGRLYEAWKFFKKERPDIVYAWGIVEATICLILQPVMRFTFINGSIRHGIFSKEASKYYRTFLLRISRNVVANSHAGLVANGLKSGFVLYNGIEDKFFHAQPASFEVLKFKEQSDSPILISVANMVPYKDYHTIFKALLVLKEQGINFTYVVIGEGPMRKELESFLKQAGLTDHVFMPGSRQNVEEWLSISDIFIHSSRGEGCSNAILEAMASGLPVIATNTGGTPEIIDSSFGFLFEYRNEGELEIRLKQLLTDLNLTKQMGAIARNQALEKYTIQSMMNNYYRIIGTITGYHN